MTGTVAFLRVTSGHFYKGFINFIKINELQGATHKNISFIQLLFRKFAGFWNYCRLKNFINDNYNKNRN